MNNKMQQQYSDATPLATPREIESTIFKNFTDQLELLGTNKLNPNTLSTIYSASNITVGDLSFGPFISCDINPGADVYHGGSIVDCENRNYGAHNLYMYTFAYWHDHTNTSTMYGPYSPSMYYNAVKGHLTQAEIGAIVVCIVAFVIIVIFLLFLLFNYLHAKHMRNALTDENEPMTILFIDIDYCTELWAGEPQAMPRVIASYYRLVRETIDKYWGYEVKILGDAFMIVCKDAYTALQLARDVQIKLLLHDWQTHKIDAAYRRYEQNKMNDNP